MINTDFADEIFSRGSKTIELPKGVSLASAHAHGVTITRVEINREGLVRPKGRYITLETPAISLLDKRDEHVIGIISNAISTLLPKEGKVLVVGVGNHRITADALGPRTVQKIYIAPETSLKTKNLRKVCAIAPSVFAKTGIPLSEMLCALVERLKPVAVLCVDSLMSTETARLGRTIQCTDTGLMPADKTHSKHLTQELLGVPVIAVGIPTLMQTNYGEDFILVPRTLDDAIAQGSALLSSAINRTLYPQFTVSQLAWLSQ